MTKNITRPEYNIQIQLGHRAGNRRIFNFDDPRRLEARLHVAIEEGEGARVAARRAGEAIVKAISLRQRDNRRRPEAGLGQCH